jgi:hypothetical protein
MAHSLLVYCVFQRRSLEQQKLLYEPLLLQPSVNISSAPQAVHLLSRTSIPRYQKGPIFQGPVMAKVTPGDWMLT